MIFSLINKILLNRTKIIRQAIFLMLLTTSVNAMASATEQEMAQAASELIHRVTPSITDSFTIEMIPQADGKDVYELEHSGNKIVLRGNDGISIASAFNHYLRDYCKVQYSIWGDQMTLPKTMPKVPTKIRVVNPRKIRHFFNYCTFNYTATWWHWDQWQKMIDILAMHGVNMPLAIVGVEAVWYQLQ